MGICTVRCGGEIGQINPDLDYRGRERTTSWMTSFKKKQSMVLEVREYLLEKVGGSGEGIVWEKEERILRCYKRQIILI